MLERIKIHLACLSFVAMLAIPVSFIVVYCDIYPIVSGVVVGAFVFVLAIECRVVMKCRCNHVSFADKLIGGLMLDAVLATAIVQAISDDLYEEPWFVVAIVSFVWVLIDSVRCLLRDLDNGTFKVSNFMPQRKNCYSLHEKVKAVMACVSLLMLISLSVWLGFIVHETFPGLAVVVWAVSLALGIIFSVAVCNNLKSGKSLGGLFLGGKYFGLSLCVLYPPYFILILDYERWRLFGFTLLVWSFVDTVRCFYKG